MIWHVVSIWCGLQPIYAFSVKDLLEIHNMCNRNRKKKEAIHAVILTAIWCIWGDRNDVVFNGKRRSYHSLFKEVQTQSFSGSNIAQSGTPCIGKTGVSLMYNCLLFLSLGGSCISCFFVVHLFLVSK
ncbi:hypothetical protein R6Q57_025196 [Mikania cordata]